MHTEHKWQT